MRCLFSAPLDFDPAVCDEYESAMDVVWHKTHVPHSFHTNMADIWVCNPKADFVIHDGVLDYFSHLKILATPSTGLNHIDLDACKRRGVKVISLLDNRAELETISASAEFTFNLLLDALRLPPARELQGKWASVVGYGRIGMRVSKWCKAFGAKCLVFDPYKFGFHDKNELEQIFEVCDAVVICCSLTPETRGMIGRDLLMSMKHGAALINTARGEIVDENALCEVMDERPDLRVAVDVLQGEVTGTADPERLRRRGAIVTPHIAGETFDSRTKAARIILGLLKRELETQKAAA